MERVEPNWAIDTSVDAASRAHALREKLTDADLRAYYENYKNDFKVPSELPEALFADAADLTPPVIQPFADELRALAAGSNGDVHVRFDQPLADDFEAARCHSVGLIDADFLRSWAPCDRASFYFCGPKPFMQSAYSALKDLDVDDARIRFEFFGPRQEILAATPASA